MFAHIYDLTYIPRMNSLAPHTFFQLLSDETRLRSLLLMQKEGELCVCELMYALELSQPKISRHLAMLRDAGLVLDRRQGQWIYYQIHPALTDWMREVIDSLGQNGEVESVFKKDLVLLNKMPNRPALKPCS